MIVLLLSRLEIKVWTEPIVPETTPTERATTEPEPLPTVTPNVPVPSPTPSVQESPLESPVLAPTPDANVGDGNLRVSNQSEHPVRVALLAQPTEQASYGQPVHWDFAPGEGKTKGLILSLPTSKLQLQEGDVLVAFAQDGSRRYWGPYVVGKTPVPTWNAETKEWLLILQP